MEATLEELRRKWVAANAAYDLATEAEKAAAYRVMHAAWQAYDKAFDAHLIAMDEAAQLNSKEAP